MKRNSLIISLILIILNTNAQVPQAYLQNQSLNYSQVIENYKILANKFPEAKLVEYGKTDVGKPLHLFIISPEKEFFAKKLQSENKTIILVNNGIHPGEPEGIDASLLLAEEILNNPKKLKKDLKNVVLCIIPVYNIGGHLNRSPYHRANQQTPEQHGYRGNSRNLDLNRDFVKLKSQNAQSFVQIFQEWKPQIFLDTHTTDGSDHQYVITLISTQHNKFPKILDEFFTNKMIPELFKEMAKTEYELTPYVYPMDYSKGPESGIRAYMDYPKISTGYASLFNSMAFMTENHIFKDYKDRVKSVWLFEKALIKFAKENSAEINNKQKLANEFTTTKREFAIEYQLDTNNYTFFKFKGYEAEISISPLTQIKRLQYNTNKPYEKTIRIYNDYTATKTITAPYAYVLPQAWPEIIDRLKLNSVKMKQLAKDTLLELTVYYADEYQKSKRQQQGQNTLSNLKISSKQMQIQCFEGDYVIFTNQVSNEYIVQMLEPEGMDSFFKWNFFDEVLEHREYFSPLGFEENAIKYLEKHPELKEKLKEAVIKDEKLAQSHYAQLKFIYDNSEYSEKSYKRIPVYRMNNEIYIPLK